MSGVEHNNAANSFRELATGEYVDKGVSGAADRRPALDQLLTDARRRRFDVLVCWRLDRLGGSLKHLISLLDDLQALGVLFVSLAEGIDATTPAGKLQRRCTRARRLTVDDQALASAGSTIRLGVGRTFARVDGFDALSIWGPTNRC